MSKIGGHDSDFVAPYPPIEYLGCFLLVTMFTIIVISLAISLAMDLLSVDGFGQYLTVMLIVLSYFMIINIKITRGHHSCIAWLKALHIVFLGILVIGSTVDFILELSPPNTHVINAICLAINVVTLWLLHSETYFGFVTYRKHHIRVMYKLRDGKPLEDIKIKD